MMIKNQFLGRLAMLASTIFSLNFACTADNAQFCDSAEACGPGRVCLGGVCEFNMAAPDGAPLEESTVSPACAEEDHACVASAPGGWSGPAIQVEQAPGESAVCPTGFESSQIVGFEGLTASGSCGCSCSDTTNFTCQNGAVEGRDGPGDFQTCFGDCAAGTCVQQLLSNGTCSAISSTVRAKELLRLNEGVVTGGTCGAGTISNNLEEPSFATQLTLCVAEVAPEGCQEGSTCAAQAPAPFDQQMCIFQEGEHDCPSDSIYQERRVIFADYDDQRSCDTCDCEPGVGGTCGFVEVFNDDPNCLGTPVNTNGICTPMPTLVSPRAKFTRRATISCGATVAPPTTGAAVEVGATTVCCAI